MTTNKETKSHTNHVSEGWTWKSRGYSSLPSSLEDLSMDYEEEHKAEKDGVWTMTIRKDEADRLVADLLKQRDKEIVEFAAGSKYEEILNDFESGYNHALDTIINKIKGVYVE